MQKPVKTVRGKNLSPNDPTLCGLNAAPGILNVEGKGEGGKGGTRMVSRSFYLEIKNNLPT